jgi:ferredoxin
MKVWIDKDLCTGDGLCEEIAPDVFTLLDDGLAYVKEGDTVYATAKGNPQGADGMADIPDGQLDAVIESAEECPGSASSSKPRRDLTQATGLTFIRRSPSAPAFRRTRHASAHRS